MLSTQARSAGFHLQTLPMTQEEVIILSQKENMAVPDAYGMQDKASSRMTSVTGDANDALVLPAHLDLYSAHPAHTLNGRHHSHRHPDLHSSHCQNGGSGGSGSGSIASAMGLTSTGAATAPTHHHVHFLHPHLSQVQILDSSDALLDPQIVTSSCNDSSTLTRNSFVRS